MKSGLLAVSLSLLRCLGLVAASRYQPDSSSSPVKEKEASRIRALDPQWEMVGNGFSCIENVTCRDVALANRNYHAIMFQEVVRVKDENCDSAHALLLQQEREASGIRHLSKDPCLHLKVFYARYKYKQSRPMRREKRSKISVPDGVLQIPRYIRSNASTHRLAIVSILEGRDREGVVQNYLQLSYENVPSQCKDSALFKPLQAKTVRDREKLYGSCGLSHFFGEEPADSDGDTNVARLSAATVLAEWLGHGVCVQVGRGGYSRSHKGMVHALLRLTSESSRLVKSFMDRNAFGIGKEPSLGEDKGFVEAEDGIMPRWNETFHNLIKLTSGHDAGRQSSGTSHTYRAVISNHRPRLEDMPGTRPESGMTLLPIPNGVITVGTLEHVYCVKNFRKYMKNTTLSRALESLPPGLKITESPCHRIMRNRAAFEELMVDVDAANAETRRKAEVASRRRAGENERLGRRRLGEEIRTGVEEAIKRAENVRMNDAALSQFKDDAAKEMAEAEERVERREMAASGYAKLCSDLRDDYRSIARQLYHQHSLE